ncbi:MAG: glucose-6-phosphate isomerase [Oscillospiraceae bacterium]
MSLKFNGSYLKGFVNEDEIRSIAPSVKNAHKLLQTKQGEVNDFLGWLDLPVAYDKEEFSKIKACAKKIQNCCDVLVVIGIGGSYLGTRAALDFIKSPNYNALSKNTPDILYAGNNISATHLKEMFALCEGKDVCVNMISKSGTTTEPAIAFRLFKEYLENKYGTEQAKERIFCTTDKSKGTLKQLCDEQGYETFVIPDDVGGRFSVLTAVGLLPLAVAGVDIDAVMKGAQNAFNQLNVEDLYKNDCYMFAAIRNILYAKGKTVEVSVAYEPSFTMMMEWIKQLYGESEGKDQKGIFPCSAIFSTDLHSLGQYVQDGSRMLFETVYQVKQPKTDIVMTSVEGNFDGLNFLEGKTMSEINKNAFMGTVLAHNTGGVPNIVLELDKQDEENFGYMVYFLEKACAISGYLLRVNPFNQPGVESYKKNMFALLGKPGYEELAKQLKELLD